MGTHIVSDAFIAFQSRLLSDYQVFTYTSQSLEMLVTFIKKLKQRNSKKIPLFTAVFVGEKYRILFQV